jgi:hypothetical protein
VLLVMALVQAFIKHFARELLLHATTMLFMRLLLLCFQPQRQHMGRIQELKGSNVCQAPLQASQAPLLGEKTYEHPCAIADNCCLVTGIPEHNAGLTYP